MLRGELQQRDFSEARIAERKRRRQEFLDRIGKPQLAFERGLREQKSSEDFADGADLEQTFIVGGFGIRSVATTEIEGAALLAVDQADGDGLIRAVGDTAFDRLAERGRQKCGIGWGRRFACY